MDLDGKVLENFDYIWVHDLEKGFEEQDVEHFGTSHNNLVDEEEEQLDFLSGLDTENIYELQVDDYEELSNFLSENSNEEFKEEGMKNPLELFGNTSEEDG